MHLDPHPDSESVTDPSCDDCDNYAIAIARGLHPQAAFGYTDGSGSHVHLYPDDHVPTARYTVPEFDPDTK